jgi:proteasome lid subunit RPN8/RPN11
MGFAPPTLRLTEAQYRVILGHCYDAERDPESHLLYEACGLLGGPVDTAGEPTGIVTAVYPCRNADASARSYTVHSQDLIRALRDAEGRGDALIGVFHSHTHTDAYPSPTDVDSAMEPTWVYAIVSLKPGDDPVLRAYRVRDGVIAECQVVVEAR